MKDTLKCGHFEDFIGDEQHESSRYVGYAEFPFLASLKTLFNGRDLNCSGVVISSNQILTSIKCVPDKWTSVAVAVGTVDQSTPSANQLFTIKDKVEFNMNSINGSCIAKSVRHGISIVTLNRDLKFSLNPWSQGSVNSVCFESEKNWPSYRVGEKLFAAGFHIDEHCARRYILRGAKCSKKISFYNGTICASHESKTNFYDLQEGSPILKLNERQRSWSILGIHSKQVDDLFSDAEWKDDKPFATFLPLHFNSTKEFIKKNVKQP